MGVSLIRPFCFVLIWMMGRASLAQDYAPISGSNLGSLQSVWQIDFADFPGELKIGWFAANEGASEFVVFDSDHQIYVVDGNGIKRSWSYINDGRAQIFTLIDAAYHDDRPVILYLLDNRYFINEQEFVSCFSPVKVFSTDERNLIFVEALDRDGDTVFLKVALASADTKLRVLDEIPFPAHDKNAPAVRIGRIDLPLVILSSLSDSGLSVFRYPANFNSDAARQYLLENGPAVFGVVIGAVGSHFAWSDPASDRLNLLDMATAENRVVAKLDGAYAQYHILTSDGSAIILVNLDFDPVVVAWDVASGRRYDLGPYRKCGRIPDKVTLSVDGTALIIGCDTGLDIWRIAVEGEERNG